MMDEGTTANLDRSDSTEAFELARVLEEYLAAVEAGQSVDPKRLVSEHPAIARRLRLCLAGLRLVEQEADVLSNPATTVDRTNLLSRLGDFQIVREVGRGGMGIVYEAEQVSLRRRVALKVLSTAAALDPRQLQRFQLEAQAVASLNHPHLVPIYSVGCDQGISYYAMQLIEGPTLAQIIRELLILGKPGTAGVPTVVSNVTQSLATGHFDLESSAGEAFAEPAQGSARFLPISDQVNTAPEGQSTRSPAFMRQVAELGYQAADALAHVHDLGLVHRDIKPANLLVDDRGHIWITDFGLARLQQGDSDLTRTGDLIGTLRYMSPEQALGHRNPVDHRTDIYSLGATLYELLTLRPAFAGTDRQELLHRIALEEPSPLRRLNPAIPADLETIVRKAMAKEPDARYGTAQDFAGDLERFLAGEPILARLTGPLTRVWTWMLQPRRVRGAGMIATAEGLFMLAWIVGAVVAVYLGLMPYPARPQEFVRDELGVIFLGTLPSIWFGWKTWKGRFWAPWGGLTISVLRIVVQAGCYVGLPPQFGGYYDDPTVRHLLVAYLLMQSGLCVVVNLVAILATHAARRSTRWNTDS